MSSIDDRVVNMQFNNDQFQKGITQTNKSLDDLKGSLKLDGATTGIDNVQQAASRFSLSNMESALQNISSKFSVLGAIGFSVINTLTNDALNAGRNIAAAVLDPLINGGERRALALQQANFQFRGLGLDIKATMDAALKSVLGTAYGLDQAATAAGQFGASGITAGHGLEESLRGIAGVAAQTGSAYDSISQIFTKVAGNGRLMGQDLLSLSANGINAAATIAKSMGKTEEQIRTMVTNGKISFADFSKAMNDAFGANAAKANELYTGALSNMNAALSRLGASVIGTKMFALRDIFNAITPVIDNVMKALKPLIDEFNSFQTDTAASAVSAITNIFTPALAIILTNIVSAVQNIGKALSEGYHSIFPDNTQEQLTNIMIIFQNISAAFIPTAQGVGELKRTFAGFFAIFDIAGQLIGSLVDTIFRLVGVTTQGSGSILTFTAKVGDFLVRLDTAIKKGEVFQTFFKTLGAVVAVPIAILKSFFGVILDIGNALAHLGSTGFDSFATDFQARMGGLVDIGTFFSTAFSGVGSVVTKVWNSIKPIVVQFGSFLVDVKNVMKDIGAAILDGLKGMSFNDGAQILNTGIFGGFLLALNGLFGTLKGTIKGNGVAILGPINIIFKQLQLNLKALEINTNAKTLTQIAIAVGILTASVVALTLVDQGKMTVALVAMVIMVKGLLTAFAAFEKLQGTKGILSALALAVAIEGIAISLIILAGAIAILGAIPLANMIQGVGALAIILAILTVALTNLNKLGPEVLASAGAIAIIAPAIVVLSGALAILGAIPLSNLVQGLGGFSIMLAGLVIALTLLNKLGPSVLLAAGAIAIIAPPLVLLTGVIAAFAAIPFLNLLQGVGAFVVILGAITGALALLNLLGPEVLLGAAALSIVGFAMVPLIGAIAILGALPLSNIIQGLVGLAAALLIVSGVVLLLGLAGPAALVGAGALVITAVGIAILAPALAILGTLSWDAIGRGLTVLAAGLVILAIGGILLIPASVGFLALGIALLALGTGVKLGAEGIGILVIAIAALVGIGSAGLAIFALAIKTFIDMLPQLGVGIGNAFVNMVVAIGAQADSLIKAFVQILLAMLKAVDKIIPQLIQTATDIIVAFVNALVILIPLVVNAGLKILRGVLKGIGDNIGEITTQAIRILVNFINAIANNIGSVINAGINLVINFINGIADGIRNNRQRMIDAGLNIADALTGGMSTGIRNGVNAVVNAAKRLAAAIPAAIKQLLNINSPSKVTTELGEFTAMGIADGLDNKKDVVIKSASDLGQAAVDGIKQSVNGISDALSSTMDMTPTIRPVLDLTAIKEGSKLIPGMLPKTSLSLDTSNNVASSVSLQEQARNTQLILDAAKAAPAPSKQVTFIQNNTSPKALSTSEVYRQTQNQLSTLKGELGVVDQSGSS